MILLFSVATLQIVPDAMVVVIVVGSGVVSINRLKITIIKLYPHL